LRSTANEMETYFTDNQVYATAAQASAGADVVIGGVATNAAKTSKNNVLTVTLNNATAASATAYCIVGTNTGASHAWVYVSSAGGLQASTVTACPATY
jgi:hypothetical protein